MEDDEHLLSDAELARALNWIVQHGHLLEYDCPDRTVPRLLRVLEERHLVSTVEGAGGSQTLARASSPARSETARCPLFRPLPNCGHPESAVSAGVLLCRLAAQKRAL
jgi:hypothetical protein